MTLSPSMIFYSGDGRGYALLILLAARLDAVDARGRARRSRTRWWVAYAAFSALAMYTHYTAAFVLIGQLGWVLWAHPQARARRSSATSARRSSSPRGSPACFGTTTRRPSTSSRSCRGSRSPPSATRSRSGRSATRSGRRTRFPGLLAGVLGARRLRDGGRCVPAAAPLQRRRCGPRCRAKNLVLVLVLLLAPPLLELLVWAVTGNDLFGPRNLGAATPGLALVIGMVVAGAGRRWGAVCAVAGDRLLRDRRGADAADDQPAPRPEGGRRVHRRGGRARRRHRRRTCRRE